MSTDQENPGPGSGQETSTGTARRVVLTVVIIGGALLFTVLPWVFLFHSPEQYAGWAVSGVVMAVAVHLFLSKRKRRQALEDMLDEEDDNDFPPPSP